MILGQLLKLSVPCFLSITGMTVIRILVAKMCGGVATV
jgi:hypothetical protein